MKKNTNLDVKRKLKQIRFMKFKYMLNCLLGRSHIKYLRKHDVFGYLGNNVLYQPNKLPNNPKLVKIHNNVQIAANVIFYEHDVINHIFENIDGKKYRGHQSCIEIMDNCFIGGNSIIVGDCKIGPNSIVAAGSVVVKDVPEGTIVGGNPAKVIGKFEDLHKKRLDNDLDNGVKIDNEVEMLWNNFYKNN